MNYERPETLAAEEQAVMLEYSNGLAKGATA